MNRSIVGACAMVVALSMGTAAYAIPGGVFVTGHDPDFHAFQGGNTVGAQHIIQDAISYVTFGKANPSILLVTDEVDPGGGYSDPRLGLTAAGFTYAVADDGTHALNLSTLNLSSYDVIVVASDFGGWLRQSELNILNARSADILGYINNNGGGLVAFAESGVLGSICCGLTSSGEFAFLPFLVTEHNLNQTEVGNTVTTFGTSLGLTNTDVNGNASHNIFTATGGLSVVDVDAAGNILSLAVRGQSIGGGGVVVPEPGTVTLLCAGLVGLGMLRKVPLLVRVLQ